MKKVILYSSVSLILLTALLFRLGVFYVNISEYNSHKLTESESILFEDAISKFWEKVENGKFDEIKNELAEETDNEYRNSSYINEFKENRSQFGKVAAWKFFRAASPQITSTWSENPAEKIYHVEYLTKAENGEFCAWFVWRVKQNGAVRLLSLTLDSPVEWRIEERDKQKLVVEKYPNEIIIPYADRYIEFRY